MSDLSEVKEKILEYIGFMFERDLTDVTGGAISVRVGDYIVATPTGICKQMFRVKADDLVVCDMSGHAVEGLCKPYVRPSSSFPVHLKIYQENPIVRSAVHAHPKYILAYSAARKNMPVVTEQARLFLGEVPVLDFAEPISDVNKYVRVLSEVTNDQVKKRRDELKEHGIAMIIPEHGILTVGKSLYHAYLALEIAEQSAFVLLTSKLLSQGKWPPAL